MKKEEIRKYYKLLRLQLSPNERETRSEEICHNLLSNFNFTEKVISLYLPIDHLNEVNTYKILEKGLSLDIRFAIPKVEQESMLLHHYLYESAAQLEVSKWGIPEPRNGKKIALKAIDFVIVPLMAFDKRGYRVGYGKGFYDQFLKKCNPNCQFIGLSYFDEPVDIDDIFVGDVPLHYLITPHQLIKFPQHS